VSPEDGSRKAFRRGTDRVIAPAETVKRARQVMDRMRITRVANVTGLDIIGIPVVMVCRPNSRSLAVSQGKGIDLDAARASGLMESIEFFHAERMILPLRLATRRELSCSNLVVNTAGLPRINISSFDDDKRILWVEGTNLLGNARTWVPYELVHADFTLPLPTGSGSFVMTSNGLASGNDMNEAVLHGLCEVIERDATTLWVLDDLAEQEARRLDLGSIDDTDCRELLDRFERAGVAVGVWETTSDVGIPSFACMIAERETSRFRGLYPTHGMGCHPVREIALSRSLTEAAQSRLTFIAGSRDDSGRERYRQASDEEIWRAARERLARGGARRLQDVPTFSSDTVSGDLELTLQRLRATGLTEAVTIDLTLPEFAIPVTRVIVPGLEPLYEVPGYTPGPRARRVLERRFARTP
jgi:ribosomal protein S12 methylthiotransferase accessory factor